MSDADPFEQRVPGYRHRIETALDHWLPAEKLVPTRLHTAMRYSTLNGGKRLRALLIYATGEVLDIPAERLDGPASALEMIHAYSLIHDDLPAMDDDDLRRGRASCHRAFDEATAILAGDALQALAFHVLASDERMQAEPAARLRMINLLAEAAGSTGMAGGQAIDLESVGQTLSVAELENMHIHKTGALIRASVMLACFSHSAQDSAQRDALDRYAKRIGLAFQVQDDILDEEAETQNLGKRAGADRALNKPTFPSVLGLGESRRRAQELTDDAIQALSGLGDKAAPLAWLASHITQRGS